MSKTPPTQPGPGAEKKNPVKVNTPDPRTPGAPVHSGPGTATPGTPTKTP